MTLIFLIILFLVLSALFSGTEIAFISASKLRVELKRQRSAQRGNILARFYDNPANFLGTMLVGNNIALVIFTILMDQALRPYLQPLIPSEILTLLTITLIVTLIVLVFGEFLPKTLFRLYADQVLFFLAYPLYFIKILLGIPAWIMTKLTNFLLRVFFGTSAEIVENAFTRAELETFIKITVSESDDNIDANLFEKALYLKDVKAKECMVPRTEIEYVVSDAPVAELRQKFIDTKLSRLLVVEEDIDHVQGYVHHQQILLHPKTVKSILLDLPFVPEVMRVRDLLSLFIKTKKNIACVVDEFGGTAGVITLEDILEEIFGEIEDEHDQEEHVEQQISEDEHLFSGRLEVDYLNQKYDHIHFPQGEYHTLSGYLVTTQESIPEQGDEIVMDGYRFIIEVVSDKRIETVRVIRHDEHKENEEVAN